MIDSKEIERLYFVGKWPATKIAKHFGVSKVTVYNRLKELGYKFTPGRKRESYESDFPREKIVEIFTSEKGSVAGAAKRLGISDKKLLREMEFHQIPKADIHPRTIRIPHLENLKIGESVEFSDDSPEWVSDDRIYKYQKRVGVRLVIRHHGSMTRVTRTPLFSSDIIVKMYKSGASIEEIAGTFLVDRKRVRRVLEKAEVTKM